MKEELLTVQEVAARLRVNEMTVRRWIIKDKTLEAVLLPGSRRRRKYRIRQSTLDVILGEQEKLV